MTNSIPYIERLISYNEQLNGLPALPIVFLSCLGFGYMVKGFPFVSNRYIPVLVNALGILGNVALAAPYAGDWGNVMALVARQGTLGGIASAAAWFVHNKFLKRLEERAEVQKVITDSEKVVTIISEPTKPKDAQTN
jgi:holin family Hol44 protein (superfamily V)